MMAVFNDQPSKLLKGSHRLFGDDVNVKRITIPVSLLEEGGAGLHPQTVPLLL